MTKIPPNAYALAIVALGMVAYAIKMPDLYVGGLISAGLVVFNAQVKAPAP